MQLELRRGEGASGKLAAHDLLDIGGVVRQRRQRCARQEDRRAIERADHHAGGPPRPIDHGDRHRFRIFAGLAYDLAAAPALGRRAARHLHRLDQLGGAEGGGIGAGDEIRDRHGPPAIRPDQCDLRLQREHGREPVGGRIRQGDRATDRPAGAHRAIGDVCRDQGHQAVAGIRDPAFLECHMRSSAP